MKGITAFDVPRKLPPDEPFFMLGLKVPLAKSASAGKRLAAKLAGKPPVASLLHDCRMKLGPCLGEWAGQDDFFSIRRRWQLRWPLPDGRL